MGAALVQTSNTFQYAKQILTRFKRASTPQAIASPSPFPSLPSSPEVFELDARDAGEGSGGGWERCESEEEGDLDEELESLVVRTSIFSLPPFRVNSNWVAAGRPQGEASPFIAAELKKLEVRFADASLSLSGGKWGLTFFYLGVAKPAIALLAESA